METNLVQEHIEKWFRFESNSHYDHVNPLPAIDENLADVIRKSGFENLEKLNSIIERNYKNTFGVICAGKPKIDYSCRISDSGINSKKVYLVPVKDENGCRTDKVLRIVEGSYLFNKLCDIDGRLKNCFVVEPNKE